MDADAAITAVVSRLPPADVAALLAARGLPAVVHGGAPARARAALAAALKDDLCEWEWEAADAGDDDASSSSGFHADIASTNGALVSCGNAIVAVGGMDAARREHAAAWRWDLSPAAADAAGFAPLRPPRGGGGGGGDDLPPHYPAGMFAAAHAGEVWVFPGPGNADLNTAAALDPATGAWRRVRTAGRPPGDDFIRRTVVGVATGGGHVWAVGGPSLDRAARFDFETRTWTRAAFANAPAPFVFGGAAWHANELWVYGAAGDDGDATIGVWRVDPSAGRRGWRAVAPPPGAPPPPPFRLHSASAVVGDRWIVHGGRTAPRSGGDPWRATPPARGWLSPFQVSAAAHEFSFASAEWRPLLADGVAAPAREWHAGLGLADCAVFVGGRTDIAVHDASPDILSTRVDVLWVKTPPPRAPPAGPAALAAALADVDAVADVTLVAADGARVPATRAVLAAHSAVFRAMWGQAGPAWAERGGGDVSVADVDGAALRALVAYCHGALAELPATMPALLSLFEAADKYDVAGLVSEVVAAAAARAAPADVAPLLAAAERCACAPLAAVCADVAAADLGGVLKQPSFVALCAAEPRAALGLVRRAVTRLGVPGCDDDDDDDDDEEEERETEPSVSASPAAADPATPARAGRPPLAPEPPTPDVAPPALAAEE